MSLLRIKKLAINRSPKNKWEDIFTEIHEFQVQQSDIVTFRLIGTNDTSIDLEN